MTTIKWQDFKCRCSALTQMLANSQGNAPLTELQVKELAELEAKVKRTPNQEMRITELVLKREKSKEVILSDTCISYLMEYYAWVTQGMISVSREMDIEQLTKGKMVEPESIALLSIVDGQDYTKNEERISNDYLTGEPDIRAKYTIPYMMPTDDNFGTTKELKKIIDIKSSWDYIAFLAKINSPIDPANRLQIQGYMDIDGAEVGEVAYCLVNMPETIINDYRRRLMYRMNVATDQNPEYLAAVKVMENSMYFDKIPRHQRVFKKPIAPLTEFDRQKIYDKVKVCRDWLANFDTMYQKLNK